jgi:hypothetical protein
MRRREFIGGFVGSSILLPRMSRAQQPQRPRRIAIVSPSNPCAKFVGDFGSATETMRIIDLFALLVFAKKVRSCKFRLLQHYRHLETCRLGPPNVR